MHKRKTVTRFGLRVSILCLLIAAISVTSAAAMNVLRVGDGQDFATIQAAVDAVGPGDLVLVYPGFYLESVSVTGSGYEIVAQDEGVVVTPPAMGEACFEVTADGVTIRGFELTGTNCAPAIRFEGSRNTFASNTIHGLTCPGVNAIACRDPDGGSNYNVIEFNVINGPDVGIKVGDYEAPGLNVGNIIRNNTLNSVGVLGIGVENGTAFQIYGNVIQGVPFGTGISISALNDLPQKDHTIAENTILGVGGHGISLFAHFSATLSKNTIIGNEIDTVGEAGIYLYNEPDAILKKSRIIENSIRKTTMGIFLEAGPKKNRIEDNIVIHSTEYGIDAGGEKNKIRNNTTVDSGSLDLNDSGSGNIWSGNRYETASWEDNRR